MGASNSFHNALEDLNAMILASDPRDPAAVARLAAQVEEMVAVAGTSTPEVELLRLVLSLLRGVDRLDTAAVLDLVATTVAELSEQAGADTTIDGAALQMSAAAMRAMLQSLAPPRPAFGDDDAADNNWTDQPSGEAQSGEQSAAVEVDAELMAEFIAESNDRIALAETATLVLERNPQDTEAINTVLRAFHTIKGASGLLGMRSIQKLAHLAESLLIHGRDGDIVMVGRPIDLTLQACDALKFMVESLEQNPVGCEPVAPHNYRDLVQALVEHDQAVVRSSEPDAKEDGHSPMARPNAAGWATDAPSREPEPRSDEKQPVASAAELAAARGSQAGGVSATDAGVRVNTDRLDNLVNLVGELVIAQAMTARDCQDTGDSANRLARSVSAVGKITRQLQDLAMGLRMVPLKMAFQRMTRLVRDLAHKSGKEIDFQISGEDTEIDRNMVEVLSDPLAHMIRNAVDHGLEMPSERAARGKSPTAQLHLRAYHAAGNVVIELEDDGQGLDGQRIRQQAIARGVIDAAAELTDEQTHALIFQPGLSTAECVTEISGRGVGLDVVKRSIESLRGRIEVSTAPGAGTKFTLRLPLTTAIIDAMTVRVGQQQYLLPTIVIVRSFRPDAAAITNIAGRGQTVIFDGRVLPLFRLHELFDVGGAQHDPTRAIVVVIEGAGRRLAILVDELLGQQQAVMKSLGEGFTTTQVVSGGAILSDGRVGLILDAESLIQLAHGGQGIAQHGGPLRDAAARVSHAPTQR